MKTFLHIICGISAVAAFIGACSLDTEGTFAPYIITAVGIMAAVISWKAAAMIN